MKKIVSWVLFIHLAALIWMSISFQSKPPKKPIVVKTMMLPSPKIQTTSPAAQLNDAPAEKVVSSQPQTKPSPIKKPLPKKTIPANPAKKPAAKPALKKKPNESAQKMQSLLQSLEESLDKIEKPKVRKKTSQATDLSKQKKRLKIDDLDSASAIGYSDNYQDQLIDLLKSDLDLPDFGEVKLKLTLKKDGTIMELIIIEAQSQKNRDYLEKNLKTVHFPVFSGGLAKENKHTFTLTFCNQL